MRSDIPKVMQAMDVLAMPSYFEGLTVTGIELQTSDLRMLASKDVPDKMDAIHLIDFFPIDDEMKKWDGKLASRGTEDRTDTYGIIKNAGYDIHTTAHWLQEFHFNWAEK